VNAPGTTRPRRASSSRVAAAFLAVYLIWGSTYLAIRFAVETLPPFLMGGARFFIAGGAVFAWGLQRERRWPSLRQWRETLLLGGLFFLGGNGGVAWAETRRVSTGVASLLVATMPLWVVILDWLRPRGHRPHAIVFGGLLLGFLGLAVLLPPSGFANGAAVDPLGALALVAGAFSWATGSLYARHAELPKSLVLASGMEMIGGGVLMTIAGLASGELARVDPSAFSTRSLLAFVYLVLFGSIVAFNAFRYLLDHAPPARVSTYAYVNPVVAVLLGWAFAAEPLTARTVAGAAIIVAAVAAVTVGQRETATKIEDLPAPIAELAEGAPPPQ
jgi:drug/metabolite transporter (DMT)-like permease